MSAFRASLLRGLFGERRRPVGISVLMPIDFVLR